MFESLEDRRLLASFTVTSLVDEIVIDDQVTLREAINSANDSAGFDEITFAGNLSGTITLGGTELLITDSVTITGPGQANLTIDANGASRALNVEGSSIDVALSGLTITGGRTTGSNGFVSGVFQSTHSGGGIRFLSAGTLSLTDSTISGNSTAGDHARGGGIYTQSGSVTLTHSTVSGNSTAGGYAYGGGIRTSSGSVTLTDSTVSGNSTAGDFAFGGGIFTSSGSVTLTGSTLSGNSTGGANSEGGGIWFNESVVTIANSTITGNSATGAGGGLRMFADSYDMKLTIHNSIIAGNTDDGTAPDFTAPTSPTTNLEVKSSLIGDTTGTSLTTAIDGNLLDVDWKTVLENDGTHPILKNNVGPTQTIALLADSPAIDVGDNALTTSTNDQRGAPFVRIANSTVDMGAYERQSLDVSSFVVTTTIDELDYGNADVSLREAINSANGSIGVDSISFAAGVGGTITLGGTELLITDSVTITGPGQGNLTIDANGASRAMNVEGSSIDVALSGLTITGGRTTGSNGFVSGVFQSTHSGGGIRFLSAGTLSLTGSMISGNSTAGGHARGGGIYTQSGSVTLSGSTVAGNNTAGGYAFGAGIGTSSGSVTLTGSTLSGNSTEGTYALGGGIFSRYGSVTLTGSAVSGNSTAGENAFGGGIFASSGSVTLTGSTLSGNSTGGADSEGGGIWFDDSVVTIVNSTITGNSATGAGGGLRMFADSYDQQLTIHNSIIAGNTDDGTAPDFTSPTSPTTNLEVKSSLIGDATGTSLTTATDGNLLDVDWKTVLENDGTHPILKNNGGPTQTIALLADSPAIDVGDNALTTSTNDQRGAPFVRIANSTVDMGAYERQALDVSSFVVTTTIDELDYSNTEVSLREAINSANGSIGADSISFAAGVSGTITLGGTELLITDSVTITGPGQANLTIDANGVSRALNVEGSSIDVALSGLTVTGGRTTDDNEFVNGPRETTHSGGGIRFISTGTLSLTDSTISGNSTAGGHAYGGGIYTSSGSVTLTLSTVSGNSTAGENAHGGGIGTLSGNVTLTDSTVSGNSTAGDFAFGGGILTSSGSVTLTGSTLSGNSTGGADSEGGGIWFDDSVVTIVNSTITGNSATGAGGGLRMFADSYDQQLTIHNSIIAGNTDDGTAPDFTAPTSPTTNLEVKSSLIGDATSTSLTTATDGNLLDVDWKTVLENDGTHPILKNNGGPTQTIALLSGGPAIDAGDNALTTSTNDQRGAPFVRIANSTVDLGAYERQSLDASSFVVTTTIDELDYSNAEVSLREAINSANGSIGADSISFAAGVSGTITLGGTELLIIDSVTITGPGQANLTIDATGASRVLNVEGSSIDLALSGLTITGGRTTDDNEFVNGSRESTHSGGGIRFLSAGTLSLTGSTVSGNSTAGGYARGGGIFTQSGSVTLSGSTVADNSTEGRFSHGGGIITESGSVTLSGSTVADNSTASSFAHGGGIRTESGSVTLTLSTVSGNSTEGAYARGGGIYSRSGSVTLTGSTVSGNNTAGRFATGGGILTFYSSVTLTGSTLSGNSTGGADSEGGGIWFDQSLVTIVNSTITGNSATGAGGGLRMFADSYDMKLTIHNSIIAGNTDDGTAPDFTAPTSPTTNLEVKSSLIGDTTGTSLTTATDGNLLDVDWKTVLENDGTHPILKNNGGPTQTIALLSGGPAIDAGDNALTTSTNDQRSAPFVRIANSTVDLGAYELQTLSASSFIVTTTTDELDYSNADVSLREAINSANGNPGADTISFAGGVGGTITLGGMELLITDSVMISGPGQENLTIDANGASRVLNVEGSSIDLALSGLTITGGRITGDNASGDTTHSGGGIRFLSAGTLSLTASTVFGNSTAGERADGGGIFAPSGSVTLTSSTLSGNSTAGDVADGGGIRTSSGDVTLTFSTLSGNSTAGRYSEGGGISTSSGNVTLTDSTLSGNSTAGRYSYGGGINTYSGNVTLTGSTLSGNSTLGEDSDGGGISTNDGNVMLTDSTLSGNSTVGDLSGGGGIRTNDGNVMLSSSTLSGNSTSGSSARGGGISTLSGSVTLTGSALSGNSTSGRFANGGGISTGRGSVSLTGSTLSGNSTAGLGADGGGIRTLSDSVTLTTSTVSGNSTVGADSNGGGIYFDDSVVTIVNSTVTGNSTTGARGGLGADADFAGELTIHNSIIAGNTDDGTAPDFTAPDEPTTNLEVRSSLIGDTAGTSLTSPTDGNLLDVDWKTVLENDGTNPILKNNGGPTQTIALLADSPAIDVGDNALTSSTNDQRGDGFLRVFDGDFNGTATVDIGAFELQPDPSDFGDAPTAVDTGFANDYPVTLDQNGARHIVGALFLGSQIDAETDGQPDNQAGQDGSGGDDNNGDADEDGVFVLASIVATTTMATTSSFEVIASGPGKIDAWIDFNRDGTWSSGEQIFTSADVVSGSNLLSFTVPAGASPGDTGARFRLSTAGGLTPTGSATDGEVEDYIATIVDGDSGSGGFVDLKDAVTSAQVIAGELVVGTESVELLRVPTSAITSLHLGGFDILDNRLTIDVDDAINDLSGGLTLNGGLGSNTLLLTGDGGVIDLRSGAINFSSIEFSSDDATTAVIDSSAVGSLSPRGPLQVIGGSEDTLQLIDATNWRMTTPVQRDGRFFITADNSESGGNESIEVDLGRPWQNFLQPGDVNNDGQVRASDALRIINELARRTYFDPATDLLNDPATVTVWPGAYFDQNGDGKITALDALRIVNQLGRQGENESVVAQPTAPAAGIADTVFKTTGSAANEDESIDDQWTAPKPFRMSGFGTYEPACAQQQLLVTDTTLADDEHARLKYTDQLLSDSNFIDHLI